MNMQIETSPSFGTLAGALAKAQGRIKPAVKDRNNPAFRSKYADLDAVWDACREALAAAEIAVVQAPHNANGDGQDIGLTTLLAHSSGEWMRSTLSVRPAKFDAQGVGSVITYLRRYALAAMVGVAPGDDDDGNAAGRAGETTRDPKTELQPPAPRQARPPAVAPGERFPIYDDDGAQVHLFESANEWLNAIVPHIEASDQRMARWNFHIAIVRAIQTAGDKLGHGEKVRKKIDETLTRLGKLLELTPEQLMLAEQNTVLAAA